MTTLNRRSFLAMTGSAGLSVLRVPAFGQAQATAANATRVGDFTFLFVTDTHLEPELNATQGCDQCFKKARTIKSDFAIQGGDHVFDSLAVSRARAASLFDLYGKTEQDLGMKLTTPSAITTASVSIRRVASRLQTRYTGRSFSRIDSGKPTTPSTTKGFISLF